MITLPQNWNTVKAEDGSFKSLEAGVYKLVIKQASVRQSKKGQEMLVVCFDIVGGDFDGYIMDLYAKRHEEATKKGEQAKYPNQGIWYQLTQGDFLPRFKHFVNCVEESNPGYTFSGDETTLKDKVFAGIFREEEYESSRDGSIKITVRCDRIIPVSKMDTAKVPPCKKLKTTTAQSAIDDETIPF